MDPQALDVLPEGVVLVAADGTVRHATPRARQLLGIGTDPVGEDLAAVVTLLDETGEPLATVPRSPVADRLAERVVWVALPDGRTRPVAVAGSFLPDGTTVLTFRHGARRQLLDVTGSDLVATVSHEIRSPLTSVKGFTRTLLLKWERFSDDQKRAMLETINTDADRVTRLLKELLDVSRIDAGRLELQRQPVAVDQVIAGVVDKARHHTGADDRDITFEVEAELPRILADPDKIEQILTNLVDNALTHAPGSPIRVTARQVGERAQISVTDQGPGIPPEQQRRIFDKFGRGRAQRRSGTGLGLYITRGLARAHGGDVWLEPTDGGGATFHVRLPIRDTVDRPA